MLRLGKFRLFLGVIAGAITYLLVFDLLAYSLAALWPDFWAHGYIYKTQRLFTFTLPMAGYLGLCWALAAVGAGWVVMKIARRREAVWVLAGLLLMAIARTHIVLEWPRFPWWYNLWLVFQAVPAVLLGGWLARSS